MPEKKHTPGPWEPGVYQSLKSFNPGHIVVSAPNHDAPEGKITLVAACGDDTPASRADACLIAAAPDLLKALEACIYAYNFCDVPSDVLTQVEAAFRDARAAVAKATGEQP